jgi:hypothetical protein
MTEQGHPKNPYTVDAARAANERDELTEWVAEFLASPGSDNAALGEQLAERIESWMGPVQVPFSELHRLAGPPGDPVLVVWDEDDWRDDVGDLSEKVEDGWEPPPLVVTFRNQQMVLEDGNHRVEGMRRSGEDRAWAVIGFEHDDDREQLAAHLAELAELVADDS